MKERENMATITAAGSPARVREINEELAGVLALVGAAAAHVGASALEAFGRMSGAYLRGLLDDSDFRLVCQEMRRDLKGSPAGHVLFTLRDGSTVRLDTHPQGTAVQYWSAVSGKRRTSVMLGSDMRQAEVWVQRSSTWRHVIIRREFLR